MGKCRSLSKKTRIKDLALKIDKDSPNYEITMERLKSILHQSPVLTATFDEAKKAADELSRTVIDPNSINNSYPDSINNTTWYNNTSLFPSQIVSQVVLMITE